MDICAHFLILVGLFGFLAASSFPIKGPEMYNSKAHNELEEVVKEFLEQIDTDENYERKKKYHSDAEPLVGHRRKTDPKEPSCQNHMTLFESNRMIDTKSSLKNGAEFLGVEKIEPGPQFSLKELQDSCVKMCCSSDSCDTAMLSLIHGQSGYRCYMFKCSQYCLFIKHKDYILLRQKSPEQDQAQENDLIQTGHKNTADIKCHKDYEFTCLKIKQCIPIYDVCDSIEHCEDKTDELNCDTNKTSTIARLKSTTKSSLVYSDYDEDYEQDLIRQQNEILEHLRQLEAQHSNRFYHPKNFLEKFMQEEQTSSRKSSRKYTNKKVLSTKRIKPLFHDMGVESLKDMNGIFSENSERHVNFGDKSKDSGQSKSDSVQAVVILVVGCFLVSSFFIYLALSTKFMSKKLRIMNLLSAERTKSSAQNVDADGDFLINGLYL